jgi:predicted ATPase
LAAGIHADDSPELQLTKLERLVSPSAVAPLAALLSIPTGGGYPKLDLSPELQKIRTHRALANELFALEAQRPVLFLVEDAHWIDPSTRELIEDMIEPIASKRVLMIVTARQEFQHSWANHPHFSVLTLNRLGQRQCRDLISGMTSGALISDELAGTIVARADGVPLFIEELTTSLIEAGTQSSLAIPSTLQDSLLARLDRLAGAKEVAQIGASIGREFGYALLADVARLPEPILSQALEKLETSGLIFRRGRPPESVYVFKHALVQDAAHASLLRTRRQELHRRIASSIEANAPEITASQPEILALHYAEAGLPYRAAEYWLLAGRLAMSRSAMREAVAQLQSGIKALDGVSPTAGRNNLEIDLQIALANASLAARGYGSTETAAAYHRAQDLLRDSRDDPRRFVVRWGLFVVRWNHADIRGAERAALEMLEDVRESANQTGLYVAHRSLAATYNSMARYIAAESHSAEAVQLSRRIARRDPPNQFGHDGGVAALAHLMLARAFQGNPEGATRAQEEALSLAEALDHASTLCYALTFTAFRYLIDRDMKSAAAYADRAVRISDERALIFWSALGLCLHGGALAPTDPENGLRLLAAGLKARAAQQQRIGDTFHLCFRAEALLAANQFAGARNAMMRKAPNSTLRSRKLPFSPAHRVAFELLNLFFPPPPQG